MLGTIRTKITIRKTKNSLSKILGFLMIFFVSLDRYKLDLDILPINITLFRLIYIAFIIFAFIKIFSRGYIIRSSVLYLLLFFQLLILLINIPRTIDPGTSNAYFLNEIMGILLVFTMLNIYSKEDVAWLLKGFGISFIFPILISIYAYYVFFFHGELISVLPLSDKLSFIQTDFFNIKPFRAGKFLRLGLPFSTSTHLGITASLVFILYFFKRKFGYQNRGSLLAIFLVLFITFGTLSRSIFVSLGLTALLYLLFNLYKNEWRVNIKVFAISLISLIFLTFLFSQTALYDKLIGRLSKNILEGRHFLIILDGIDIWTKNIKNFFFGIGDGNLGLYYGSRTDLPPASLLSSYFTTLVFRGIVGFFSVYMIYFVFALRLFKDYLLKIRYENSVLFFGLINIIFAFLLYELRFVLTVWIFIGIISVYLFGKENVEMGEDNI